MQLSLLAAGASAEADPQLLLQPYHHQPLIHTSPLIKTLASPAVTYTSPLVYKTAEKTAEMMTKKVEHKPVVYTMPMYNMYKNPVMYTNPMETKVENVMYNAQPAKHVVYNTAPIASPYYSPMMYHANPTVVVKAAEPMPKYVAKNGEIEHKVYKREAEAEPEADAEAQVFYNTYGYWPTGYTGYKTMSAPAMSYTNAVPATTYTHAMPMTSYAHAMPTTTYSAPLTYTNGVYGQGVAPFNGQYWL